MVYPNTNETFKLGQCQQTLKVDTWILVRNLPYRWPKYVQSKVIREIGYRVLEVCIQRRLRKVNVD